ncbi:MAG: hypothetical protein ACI841_004806 [Planctomycetota bacterium]|jgi:hypothetical protein
MSLCWLATLILVSDPSTQALGQGGVMRFCQSGASGATISASGSTDFDANAGSGELVLHARALPQGTSGMFFYGNRSQAPLPFGGGSLCVGSTSGLGRLGLVSSGPSGHEVSQEVDFMAAPSVATTITPGSSWYFQFVLLGAAPDLTDALRIQFVPPLLVEGVIEFADWPRSTHPLGQTADGGMVVMNTQAELQSFWDQHAAGFTPPPPVPVIDMGQHTVISVHAGRRFTLGYDIAITEVALSVNTLRVTSEELRPTSGTVPSETNPMHMVALRKVEGARLGEWIAEVRFYP